MQSFVKVMGIPFLSTTMNKLVDVLDDRLAKGEKTFLVTANPEIMMAAEKDERYYRTIESADFVIPDGVGILVGARILGTPIPDRLPGYELMLELFKLSAQKGYKIYLLGAKEEVLEEAVKKARENYPGIQIVGHQHGYADLDDPKIVDAIRSTQPDMIFVGLGFPKQEYWIDKHKGQFEKGLFIGVGGSFDHVAGVMKRAPEIWIKMNLEWLYRLMKHPSRWRRMLALPAFVVKMVNTRVTKKAHQR